MSQRLRKNLPLLRFLSECNKAQRSLLLKNLTRSEVTTICECVDNVLRGNVPIDQKTIRILKLKRKNFALIRDKKLPLRERKDLIIQTGGFLPTLLLPIISTAASLLGNLLIK